MTDRGLMKRYLLGLASPQERIALEAQYVSSPEAFEELTEVENDLIDSYSHGKLSELERREFEKRYLGSSKGRARLSFSQALAEVAAEVHPADSGQTSMLRSVLAFFRWRDPGFRWAMAAACAIALVLAIVPLRLMRNRDLQARSGSSPTTTQPAGQSQAPPSTSPTAPTPDQGVERPEVAKAEPPAMAEFTLPLDAGVSRTVGSGTAKTFVVPSGTSWLNLQLRLEDDEHLAYVAVVETVEGSEISRIEWLKSGLVSGVKTVTVRLPVRLVPRGDYIVDLKARGDDRTTEVSIESYSFRVVYK